MKRGEKEDFPPWKHGLAIRMDGVKGLGNKMKLGLILELIWSLEIY